MRTADLSKLFKDHETLYEDGHSRPQQQLTFERWTPRTHVRQNVSKYLKARQMCVDTNAISKNPAY